MVEIVRLGVRNLGENRVQVLESHRQEFAEQAASLGVDPDAVQWHMIGHLQRNKVKQVLPQVVMVQSVDSLRLAREISNTAVAVGRTMPILLEVNAGQEPQKHGFPMVETPMAATLIAQMPGLEVRGLMAMAPLTEDTGRIRQTFADTRSLFERIRYEGNAGDRFTELSMGMTGDFEIAIEEGATIIRIGSLLFGEGAEGTEGAAV